MAEAGAKAGPPAALPTVAAAAAALRRFRSVEFQWFLTELSVRPTSLRAMVAHLLPCLLWRSKMRRSSSGVKARRCTPGLSWLHQRRRQDLPVRPGISALMTVQFRAPWRATASRSSSSSSGLHDPLILPAPAPALSDPPPPSGMPPLPSLAASVSVSR
uniref:Uncharacterized protein n=1 Tax=Triticum urartu TaxID=4572 RepID=A0A8R7K0B1_TRIUA